MRRLTACLALLLLLPVASASAADSVKTLATPGSPSQSVSGVLQSQTKDQVVIQGKELTTIPVNEIDYIVFDGEPSQIRTVRSTIAAGSYDSALQNLDRIDVTNLKPDPTKDVQFYRALCNAKKALGSGKGIAEAGKAMDAFVKSAPDSYHFYRANEVLGDLLVAAGAHAEAQNYYAALTSSPVPAIQMKGSVALGRALLAQQPPKTPEALSEFEKVIALAAKDAKPAAVAPQLFAANLGKAACIAEQGQADEGIKLVLDVISKTPAEDAELQGQAYVTLGRCYDKKGAKKEALLAYLHVPMLYSSNPQADAAALKRLVELWKELGKPERAQVFANTLAKRYGAVAGQ